MMAEGFGTDESGFIGRSVPRLEDPPLVTGAGRYAADISFPNQLTMRIVRSGHAHGRILSIDTSMAARAPGVVAIWTAADVSDVPPVPYREGVVAPLEPYRQPVLAKDIVRYVGEPVAVVFATDEYLAEDAADLVEVTIDPVPVLLAADGPVGEFAPELSTEALVMHKGFGDCEAAFRAAHTIVELKLTIGRHSGVPLETRGAIARHDAARDVLELYGAAKVPHRNRETLATLFGRKIDSVQLYEGHVGGGFGIRGEIYPEDILACAAALRFARPVKWIEDRREHLIAANHSRQQHHHIRAALDADALLLAIDDEFFLDQGGYPRTHAARVIDFTAAILPGPYRLPVYRVVGRLRLTNKTPAATYRSPGRYEGTFARERLMDAIAEKFGIDRIEVRRRNLIPPTAMPYAVPLEAIGEMISYDSGDYERLLDKALAAIGWDALSAQLAQRRAAGEAVGAGIAMFVDKSGLGPTDGVKLAVDATGQVELITGGASVGQGFETVMAQICADGLGVDYRGVRVIHGQTDRIARGIGAHASRATVMTGSATHIAAKNLRALAITTAAELMQSAADRLEIVGGRVRPVDRAAGPSMTLGEIAAHLEASGKSLAAEGWFHTSNMNYPYGVQIAVVKVDQETGGVAVERYLIAFDLGRAVNPMLVEGQLRGGFAQGLGGALYEEFTYDEQGAPQSVTFADYLIPTSREVPPVEILLSEDAPSPRNPLGIKGAGEGGITAVGAAIASAIDAAIGMPGAVTRIPVTPVRLLELMKRGQ
jgi:aerobic carbon-monoxide dehydrogenase large subunit